MNGARGASRGHAIVLASAVAYSIAVVYTLWSVASVEQWAAGVSTAAAVYMLLRQQSVVGWRGLWKGYWPILALAALVLAGLAIAAAMLALADPERDMRGVVALAMMTAGAASGSAAWSTRVLVASRASGTLGER